MENRRICSALLLLPLQFALTIGIILQNVTIPHYGVKDGSVDLGCEFHYEVSEKLLFLKWYQNDQEFFRFTAETKTILTFPLDGVFVDTSRSTYNRVTLRNMTLKTSGLFKCEAMVERTFQTASGQGHMVIIAPPQSNPVFTGVHPLVNIGERIVGNCTSYRSKPAAALTLYINEIPENPDNVQEYSPVTQSDGLENAVLGFNFVTEPTHFKNGFMKIKCLATIGNLYWVQVINVSEVNIDAQPSFPGHNRLSSGSAFSTFHQALLSAALSLQMLVHYFHSW